MTTQYSTDPLRSRRAWLSIIVCAALPYLLAGCASKAQIKDVMLPLTVVRKIVLENMPVGVLKESLNGREITSEYFNPKSLDEPAETKKDRAQAVVTILGSRRPYQIAVVAFVEERRKGSKKQYDSRGEDPKIARKVSERIQEALANRPADLNVIDDFRAF